MYLKINDSKSAFERLFDVTKLNERYAKALVALGAILQVGSIKLFRFTNPSLLYLFIPISRKTTLTEPSTSTGLLIQRRTTVAHCGVTLVYVSTRNANLLR